MNCPNSEYFPIVCQSILDGHTATIRAKGNSMRPFIESDRDLLVIGQLGEVRSGDVVLAEIGAGHYVLHRVDSIRGNQVVLRGDGNVGLTEQCEVSDLRAKLMAVIRNGREWKTDSCVWQTYSLFWHLLLPFRRYLLAFYRLCWRKK